MKETLTKPLHTHVTDKEGETIARAATKEGRSVSAFIRRSILQNIATENAATDAKSKLKETGSPVGRELVVNAIAQTLETLAMWTDETHRESYRYLARDVRSWEPDQWDICCPFCDEIECDEGCPMSELRTQGAQLGKP